MLEQALELDRVDLTIGQPQLVPPPARDDLRAVAVEQPAQTRDVELNQLGRAGRRALAPESLRQAVGRHGTPDLEREHRQDGALLARAERDRPIIEARLDRPEEK